MNQNIWRKRTTNFRESELVKPDKAAKERGYKNLHDAMRSLTLSLLAENPTAA